jgi:hypothetical protein
MEKSKPSEVEAVLGHELGHWYFCMSSAKRLMRKNPEQYNTTARFDRKIY